MGKMVAGRGTMPWMCGIQQQQKQEQEQEQEQEEAEKGGTSGL